MTGLALLLIGGGIVALAFESFLIATVLVVGAVCVLV